MSADSWTRHERASRKEVSLPAGYYVAWSGRWENQEHARQRLQLVLPIVLLVIFVLLYFTYHSVAEAAHVLLAVPFALTGGVYLLWLLGYNFSVAVWVGFIALFGTAVQTGVVMVIYLEEAVARKRAADGWSVDAIGAARRGRGRGAVSAPPEGDDGEHGRRRSAADHVEHARRSEVMKPLATPVLGGMVSSLLHVLVVTPVIFFWLHERRLGLHHEALPAPSSGVPCGGSPSSRLSPWSLRLPWRSCCGGDARESGGANDAAAGQVVQQVNAGGVQISLLSPTGTLHQGRNVFTIEFRSADGRLVDAGAVRASGNMAMPGMVMSSGLQVLRTDVVGRYQASAEFGMAGAWHMAIEWDGPAGKGSVNFEGAVQ